MLGRSRLEQRAINLYFNVSGKKAVKNFLWRFFKNVIELRFCFLELGPAQRQHLFNHDTLLYGGLEFVINDVYRVDFSIRIRLYNHLGNISGIAVIELRKNVHEFRSNRNSASSKEVTSFSTG